MSDGVIELDLDEPRTAYVLALADDELVIGHRHSFWTAVAPSLEEDLAFSTIAQDEINHADVWYQLLVGEDRAAVNRLGLGREPDQYRHAVLCERPPGDFAYTLARQWLYDHFDAVRLDALISSRDPDLAATARRLLHEERYHRIHADEWLRRVAREGEERRHRVQEAIAAAWRDALGLFEPPPGEERLVAEGTAPASQELVGPWMQQLEPILDECDCHDVVVDVDRDASGWRLAEGVLAEPGGRHGRHTADWLEEVWPEMTGLYRSDPDAVW